MLNNLSFPKFDIRLDYAYSLRDQKIEVNVGRMYKLPFMRMNDWCIKGD